MVALMVVTVLVAGGVGVLLVVAATRQERDHRRMAGWGPSVVDLRRRRETAGRTAATAAGLSEPLEDDGVTDYPNFI